MQSAGRLFLRRFSALLCLALFGTQLLRAAEPAKQLELQQGDRICLVGNTLAERMQHDGWLETFFYSRFPKLELVFRDLGYSGDELTLRLRSAGFGSPDEHLTHSQADVIFAFFGYNEAFAGKAGLEQFKTDLANFIKHTLEQKYNGKSAPRLVLFSPIAHEDLHDRNLPDGKADNARLALYTAAMRDVAAAAGVLFVDLYEPTLDLYVRVMHPKTDANAKGPLTINGVHLNDYGDRLLAQVIDANLFSNNFSREMSTLQRIRRAVIDKNFYWYNRYRTVDGYSIYGGRADLAFVGGQTNRVVMQRELEVLDVMTANRDRSVWAIAQGGERSISDGNTPEFIPVTTNKPGAGPNGEHLFLDGGDEALGKIQVAEGMKVNLFASEKDFPELANPVQMAFDTKGRLWVATMPSYPHWKPKEEMDDRILILEDTDGDGHADVCKTFADKLHVPTGLEFWNGGLFVGQQPDLIFLKDTDGDDKADVRVRVLHGIDSADTHHALNSFVLDPGGALYFQEGTFHHTQVETAWGPPVRCANAGVYRYEPRTQKFDVFVSYGFANPHGHSFDRWGQDIVHDGTGAQPYHGVLFSGHVDFPNKHAGCPQVYQQQTRPCPGTEYLSSKHFPDEMQGRLIVGNVIGFQGLLQYEITDKDSSLAGTQHEPILQSTDPNFRPTDLEIGPDGAIYFTEWQNPIIGHMQHNLRDPSRDRTHGRVYRVTYAGRPLAKRAKIAGQPLPALLELLKEPEARVRDRARIELSGRKTDDVIAAAKTWLAGLNKSDPEYQHHVLEGLWLHQAHNVVNVDLLNKVLASPDFHARSAAVRVLCYWRDRVPGTLELLKKLAADDHPRVRLEAVRAASFFPVAEAVEVPVISLEHPTDVYLDYTRNETLKTLEPYWKKALAEGKPTGVTSDAGLRYLVKNFGTGELLKLLAREPSRGVGLELLFRPGLRDEQRREALTALARLEKKADVAVLLDAIRSQERQQGNRDESVGFDLVRLLASGRQPDDLSRVRNELEDMAVTAALPVNRELAFVALATADDSIEKAWELANRSLQSLTDLVNATPLIPDPNLRAALYPKISPLLEGLPKSLADQAGLERGPTGRFVRVELRGRKTLTIAEVDVLLGSRNLAREGKATQKNTAHGGDARRAIDGNKDSSYGAGGQTHTEENTQDPWWELDLGQDTPIESIVVHNRVDGELGQRLQGFSIRVLDSKRNEVFAKHDQAAPKPSVAFVLAGIDPATRLRWAAMLALTSVRGQEGATFKALTPFVARDADRSAAIEALQRIPASFWPADQAPALLETLLGYIRKLPTEERTGPAALGALQFGYSLAALLPADEAKAVRRELGELGVQVVRVGTLTDRMLYDIERVAVQAGKPVEFVFDNTDIMPHNFVIVRPGALEQVGLAAEAQATQPGALERHYVPSLEAPGQILLASRLLQPRQAQKLNFAVPQEPGIYPFVCTYPGHWRRMYGALYVVENLEDYLADPEGYLAAHPLSIRDELLKFNRPRKEWKLEELSGQLEELAKGRSFATGKQMFQVAGCIACHKLNGSGQEFGPDLAKLDDKMKPLDILKEIFDPSEKINEKYQTWTFETQAGKVISGLILEETKGTVKIVENPLLQAEPLVLKVSDIAERQKSATSIMPKGLFDKLTLEEILDLLAYVWARGDQKSPIFSGGHDHHAH
ncbi:MAG: c-type cytochrome [Planctomycetaceae bacterium]|nr:c-type cytochrome [Planctomycetaceae bacterium]